MPYAARFFVLRTPLLPAEPWPETSTEGLEGAALDLALAHDQARMEAAFRALVQDPRVREALYVASPDLDRALSLWLQDPAHPQAANVPATLFRYLTRMRGRATPFGLFAGSATGEVCEKTHLTLSGRLARHTRLDMGYLTALCAALEPALRPTLTYRPTPALAPFEGEHRYAEGRTDPETRSRHNDLVSLRRTPAVDAALGATPGSPDALAEAVRGVHPEVSREDALGFIDGLIDASVLVSQLSPPITSEDPLGEIVTTLAPRAPDLAGQLGMAASALDALDQEGLGHPPARYEAIAEALRALPAPPDPRRLFQVDQYRPDTPALSPAVIRLLQEGVELLHGLTPPEESEPFRRFMTRFEERWGDDERPLTEVLDEERGIGFGAEGRSGDLSPLLRGLPFSPDRPAPGAPFDARARLRLRRVLELGGAGEWSLSDADLAILRYPSPPPLPDALSVMGVLAAPDAETLDRGEGELFLHHASGPSGVSLMGRFCLGDPRLRRHVEAHMRAEEARRPDAIFAEVVYSPEGRMGNVICRPRLRPWEIPYLGRGAAPEDHQIPISDLAVRVHQGRILLRSVTLDRPVIPCLTSAHNHGADDLPIYRFLAVLSRQGLASGLSWSWGALDTAPALPRVRRGRIVLSLATWNLEKDELSPLLAAKSPGAQVRAARALAERRRLPRRVQLQHFDNVLDLDLERPLALDALISAARGGSVSLREPWPPPEARCVAGPEGRHVHEIVVPLLRDDTPPERPIVPPVATMNTRRASLPGSEWLYLQIYCGSVSADAVLRERVAPLVEEARARGELQRWFYIHYTDPEWHLRVRLRAGEHAPALLARAHALLEPWRQDQRIWRVRVDTYQPEIERYGGAEGIILAERLFQADSDAALAVLQMLDGDEGEDARWRLTLRALHLMLEDLSLPVPERIRLLGELRASWAARVGADKGTDAALNALYRKERPALEAMIAPTWDPGHPLAPGFEILDARRPALQEIGRELAAAALNQPVSRLVQSYAHMTVNRWLRSQANAAEVVLYDLLIRLYKSQSARAGAARSA